MNFGQRALAYFLNIKSPVSLPNNVQIINPYLNEETGKTAGRFFRKFFTDNEKRRLAFGINPGRFGGGITGVSFTDPVALEKFCGIKNGFDKRTELSSEFIYTFIEKYGGTEKFYSHNFLSALYPLALIKGGKNYNFYDEKKLYSLLKPSIIQTINAHIGFGALTDAVICLGRKNSLYLNEINEEKKFFGRIIVLDHPRYIMQYKRKSLEKYLGEYLSAFR